MVVGLILTAGLIAVLLVNYQLRWVPLAKEEHQVDHMARVSEQMTGLIATLDKQLLGEVNTTVSTQVSLGVPGKAFPSMAPISHSMTLESASQANRNLTLNAATMRVYERDGTSLAGVDEAWWSPGTNTSIRDVDHLRLRFSPMAEGSTAEVQIVDASGVNAGWLNVTTTSIGAANYTVNTVVENPSGTEIAREERFATGSPDPYFIDALAPSLQFDDLLAAAAAPFTITVTSPSAEYAMTYDQTFPGGVLTRSSGGQTQADWQERLRSATLSYEATNPDFVDQSYTVENGALLLVQQEGAGFAVDPRLGAWLVDDNVALTLTLPRLAVQDAQVAGNTPISLQTTTLETHSLAGWTDELTLTVNTSAAAAWASFVTETLEDAGIDASYYTVTTTTSTASLRVTGNPSNGSGVEDVSIVLRHTLIRTQLVR